MAGEQRDRPSWIRYSGMGVEFAAAVAGLTVVGYWIDRRYGCEPWGVVIGAALGLIGGTYNFVRESLQAIRQAEQESKDAVKRTHDRRRHE